MMRRPLRASLHLTLALAALAAPAAAQQVTPEVFVLENGMKFILLPRDEEPNIIAAGWLAKVGSADERPGITGVTHFLEHMMFKGTDRVGTSDAAADASYRQRLSDLRDQIREAVIEEQYKRYTKGEIGNPWDKSIDTPHIRKLREQLTELEDEQRNVIIANEFDQIYTNEGASGMNAGTGKDFTFYYINIPSNKLELWTWMESDRLMDPSLREFDAERDVVVEERRQTLESNPTGELDERFDSMFWVSSPYAWPVVGWMSDLFSYTEDQVRTYFRQHYQPSNLIGVVVGDFDPAEAKPLIRSYFGRLVDTGVPTPAVVTYEVPLMGSFTFEGECDCQPQCEVRYQAVPFGHKDEAALEVLADILNGRTGRLYKALVEEQKIAQYARAGLDASRHGGSFSFTAGIKGDATPPDLEAAWFDQVALLQDELVSDHELQKVKNQSAADAYRRLQSNSSLLFQLAIYECMDSWEAINTRPHEIQAVTAKDIQRVARQYLRDDNRAVALYTRRPPEPSAAPVAEMTLEDALAGMPENAQAMMRQAIPMQLEMLRQETDFEKLELIASQARQSLEVAPPERQPLMRFILQEINKRIADLRTAEGSN
ncbi:MAG: insulinase family protein [Phycisphaerales bacterium]|nr:insulinase family protein [Phycisphaerales bacterium]